MLSLLQQLVWTLIHYEYVKKDVLCANSVIIIILVQKPSNSILGIKLNWYDIAVEEMYIVAEMQIIFC